MAEADGGGARPGWRWDVALSFAGAQRDYVEKVAQALMARGVRCFYDADEQIELWGKYLAEELPVIYAEQAAAVVVFVSAEYAARDWTKLERRAALARAVRERREYVLPARFDDTPLPGLLPDMVSVDLRTRTPQQFAVMIADKLAALGIAALDQSARTRPAVHIIQPPGREATLIISEPVRASWPPQDRILTAALRAAQEIPDEGRKAEALARIAEAMAATDPNRAARLTADAERIARAIPDEGGKAEALADLAGVVAPTDPGRAARLTADAERAARAITDETRKVFALADLAEAMAATDSDRAELIARAIPEYRKAEALADLAEAMAATDPDRAARLTADAERAARAIPYEYQKTLALADLAGVVAATDPDRAARLTADAERIAQAITDEYRASALASIEEAMAATDPDRAERIAQAITDEYRKAEALARIAGVVAATDPDRAERIAQTIPYEYLKAEALTRIAEAMAAADPDRSA